MLKTPGYGRGWFGVFVDAALWGFWQAGHGASSPPAWPSWPRTLAVLQALLSESLPAAHLCLSHDMPRLTAGLGSRTPERVGFWKALWQTKARMIYYLCPFTEYHIKVCCTFKMTFPHITLFITQLDKKEWEMMCRVKPDVVWSKTKKRREIFRELLRR